MTNITFKNGKPLFLSGDGAPGLVAASQNCCCPPPPPPECWCPDFCLYQIEILSPVQFGPGPTAACGGLGSDDQFEVSLYPPCEDEEECCGPVTEPIPGLVGPTLDRVYAFTGSGYARVRYSSKLAALADAQVSFRCDNFNERGVTYADISLLIGVPSDEGLIARTPRRFLSKFATVELDSTCSLRTGVTCNPVDPNEQVRLAFLDTPLEFTVNNASAGLVGWDESRTVDVPIGDQTRVTPCFDHLVDNFEATFRITARENCLPPEPLCCCDETGFRVLEAEEECTGSQFPQPDPSKSVSLVFEWCGLAATEQLQSGIVTYFADEVIDEFVCDTTGRYGPEASYTQATLKELSVTILSGGGLSACGYEKSFIVSVANQGTGFRFLGGSYVAWENVTTAENYDCTVYQCFDGSAAVVTMVLSDNTTDDTCGGTGNFDPCKFTEPEVTVVVAP